MFNQVKVRILILLIAIFLLGRTAAKLPIIIQGLSNVTAAANGPAVDIVCLVMADNLYWIVNDTWYNAGTHNELIQKGIEVLQLSYYNDCNHCIRGTMIIDVSSNYYTNNTVIQCHAHDNNIINESSYSISSTATITIADVPLPPSPEYSVMDVLNVQVDWETPFTWPDFPITNYTVTVEMFNQTSAEWVELIASILSPDTHSFSIARSLSPCSCTKLKFIVTATSEVGTSLPGVIPGRFAAAPGMFVEAVSSEVILTVQGTPHLDIIFTFPFLCPFSDATYSLVVTDTVGGETVTYGPYFMSWSGSGSQVTVEIRQGLVTNVQYTANITVTTLAGQSFTCFSFNTSFDKPIQTEIMGAGIAGGSLLLVMVTLSIAILCTIKRRKLCCNRAKQKPNTCVALAANPVDAGAAIYEEIPGNRSFQSISKQIEDGEGYLSIASAAKNPALVSAENQYSIVVDHPVSDEMYIVMKSAGTLTTQH